MNNLEVFKLKLSQEQHLAVLKNALQISTFGDPDIFLVSIEGFKIYTHRSLLCLHSKLMSSLLPAAAGSCCCTQGVSVPAPAASLHTLIQLLVEGSTKLSAKKGIKMVTDAAYTLGLDLNFIEQQFSDNGEFGNHIATFELKTKSVTKSKISRIEFDGSSSLPKQNVEPEEHLKIKSELQEDEKDIENNYSTAIREPGEVFSNDYDEDYNENEFDMLEETPVTSNAEIRAEMRIQSPGDPNHICYECKFCKKVFANITHLKRHLPSHTGEKPFHCVLCGLKFSRKDNLLIHKRTRCVVVRTALEGTDVVHEDDITCTECGKNFLRGNDFKRHMMCHTGVKPYNCEVCGKGFIQKSRFKSHVESHINN
eukprot:GFUD01020514.1.p1 GENE.GFUD01020514.1~~GFUD01020514.1.p1  ORF type:complete len:367 (-),score=96.69 GFUD01020514.1:32-1132(-)